MKLAVSNGKKMLSWNFYLHFLDLTCSNNDYVSYPI